MHGPWRSRFSTYGYWDIWMYQYQFNSNQQICTGSHLLLLSTNSRYLFNSNIYTPKFWIFSGRIIYWNVRRFYYQSFVDQYHENHWRTLVLLHHMQNRRCTDPDCFICNYFDRKLSLAYRQEENACIQLMCNTTTQHCGPMNWVANITQTLVFLHWCA